ncbi:hypothetical protein IGB42_01887 [Andreprevotia sp. IGB-42]|uniref:hypothetical protein n=1 Tax=Andreprevotia sp. IGB-42 TaxID=2497473 RepID=UPI00135CBB00|nr:hypothetical protein [Andreprevotia sp. IGB-42]KAF0813536.1 hypothetical protein IGB42_01887 [Andreprevotia sp. IGB-42]
MYSLKNYLLILLLAMAPACFAEKQVRNDLLQLLDKNGRLAQQAFIYKSAHNYQIWIPAGYTYASQLPGQFEFVAVKDLDGIATPGVAASFVPGAKDFRTAARTTRDVWLSGNKTNVLEPISDQEENNAEIQRFRMSSTRDAGKVKGFWVFIKRPGGMSVVIISGNLAVYDENQAEFEKMVASITLH